MLRNIEFKDLNVKGMLSDFYVVPDYQREYVWEEENVEQLLEDVSEACTNNFDNLYYTGSIVVCPSSDKDVEELELIDGQQRITTFYILMCVLRNLYRHSGLSVKTLEECIYASDISIYGEEEEKYRVVLQYEDATDCLEGIAKAETFPIEVDESTNSTRRLCEAANTIHSFVSTRFKPIDDLKRFCGYVLNKVCFVRITTDDVQEALKIFETINQRGVGLTPMDLMKNMVFKNLKDREKFGELNEIWREMIRSLEGGQGMPSEKRPLRFLRYYLMARYDTTDVDKNVLREGDIASWLAKHPECGYAEDPVGFVEDMREGAKLYMSYLKPDDTPRDRNLWNIVQLGGSAYRVHLMLLLAATKMGDAAFTKFKKILESIVYYTLIDGIDTNITEPVFVTWCKQLREVRSEVQLDEFVDAFVRPRLNDWKRNNFENFAMAGYGTMRQYRVKALLCRIAAYVQARVNGERSPRDADMAPLFKLQIEHIMPKKCGLEELPSGLDQEQYDYYKDLLGNLTPLEQPRNGSISNLPFEDKVKVYANAGYYLTQSIAALDRSGKNNAITRLNDELEEWSEWGPKEIEERQAMLYKLSEEIWAI